MIFTEDDMIEYDTGWVNLTARRIGKTAHLQGRVQDGVGTIATLPAEFRPNQTLSFAVREESGATTTAFIVNTDGTIVSSRGMTAPNIAVSWFVD